MSFEQGRSEGRDGTKSGTKSPKTRPARDKVPLSRANVGTKSFLGEPLSPEPLVFPISRNDLDRFVSASIALDQTCPGEK